MDVEQTNGGESPLRRILGSSSRNRTIAGTSVVVVALIATFVLVRLGSDSKVDFLAPKGGADEDAKELTADDPKGSPHVVLPDEFDPSSNEKRTVPEELTTDADEVLTVESATLVDGNGPYDLVWTVKRSAGDPVACRNCAFVDARVKSIIKAVLDSDVAEGVEEIIGLDVTRTLAGDYSGNGWQAEFVVGSTATGYKNGEQLAEWILKNSKDNKVHSVLWRNLLYKEDGVCDANLAEAAPVEAYPQDVPETGDAQAIRDAGMDRIIVSSPSYEPTFEDRDGAQFVSAWKATGC